MEWIRPTTNGGAQCLRRLYRKPGALNQGFSNSFCTRQLEVSAA
jgi:hypothetical protein